MRSLFLRFVALLVSLLLVLLFVGGVRADTITYFQDDLSGSPLLATDSAANVLWRESYKPYGDKLILDSNSVGNQIGFHGKPFDDDTGLSYMGARYYNPVVGRFLAVDPNDPNPENSHSINRYSYANNNPYKFVDPDGHTPVDVAFIGYDLGKLGASLYRGESVAEPVVELTLDVVGVLSPVPFTGEALKGERVAERSAEAVNTANESAQIVTNSQLRKLGRTQFESSRADVLSQNNGICAHCRVNPATSVDHIEPVKKFVDAVNSGNMNLKDAVEQSSARSNLTGACGSCNSSKGSKTLSDTPGPGLWVPPYKRTNF
ncbi:RHS repeat-associated core domain-containing protein [Pseudomonas putida]